MGTSESVNVVFSMATKCARRLFGSPMTTKNPMFIGIVDTGIVRNITTRSCGDSSESGCRVNE